MIKILYITSTLGKSGPTNQTYNIISNLDKQSFNPVILTLSPEPHNSMWKDFEKLGIEMQSLNLSRFRLFFAKKRIKNWIKTINPNIIHTQNIRADNLVASLKLDIPWILTLRGYPFEEFPMNYGALIGQYLAKIHIRAIRKCKNVVACSKILAERFKWLNINAFPIQNGVSTKEGDNTIDTNMYNRPIFITTGGISRKNVAFAIEAFIKYRDCNNKGSLLVLGDEHGLEQKFANKDDIYFCGKVDNIRDYYKISDLYISASLSEGLPNAVLEVLSSGIPVLLSDIPSHREINNEFPNASVIFTLNDTGSELIALLKRHTKLFPSNVKSIAQSIAQKHFSDKAVSTKYQKFYRQMLIQK
jgi:glycosyltransferase involved in cell wall biosynthesis